MGPYEYMGYWAQEVLVSPPPVKTAQKLNQIQSGGDTFRVTYFNFLAHFKVFNHSAKVDRCQLWKSNFPCPIQRSFWPPSNALICSLVSCWVDWNGKEWRRIKSFNWTTKLGQNLQWRDANATDTTKSARNTRQRAETSWRSRKNAARTMGRWYSSLRGPYLSGSFFYLWNLVEFFV